MVASNAISFLAPLVSVNNIQLHFEKLLRRVHTCQYATEIACHKKYRQSSSSWNTFTHSYWEESAGRREVNVNNQLPSKMFTSSDNDDCD
ncbi:hypothetical protein E2C01_055197 [Portunus trituberculatus]|uniref:Uncharacterized protein n=1 Tax=Portunus trituberculatus TaxID=210409 RepID=A0A5B7GU25_PORTR|nr:hypothetical protein [Portunus trituberculatus]